MKEMATILSKEFKTQGNQITIETQTQLQVVLTSDIYILLYKKTITILCCPYFKSKAIVYIVYFFIYTSLKKRCICAFQIWNTISIFLWWSFFFPFFFLTKPKYFLFIRKRTGKKIGDFILTWGMRSNYLYLSVLIDNTNIC